LMAITASLTGSGEHRVVDIDLLREFHPRTRPQRILSDPVENMRRK